MAKQEIIVDFSSQESKARLWSLLRSQSGKVRVEVCRYAKRRSDAQNAYYWGVVVQLFMGFLNDQGENYTKEEVHDILRSAFLRKSVINHTTGEVVCETLRSTTELSTVEFQDYIERCVAWLADMFGIIVPDPGDYVSG